MNIARVCRKPGSWLLPAVILVFGCNEKHPQVVEIPPPVVQVSQPVESMVTDYQVFTARTQAVQSVEIKARVTGFLTKILFKDGDEVKEGDVLFQIDDRPYKAALDLAKASVELSKAALVKAQTDYNIGVDLQKMNAAAISEQDLTRRLAARDESRAGVNQALASLENAQLNYNWCKVTAPISGRTNIHFVDVGNLVTQNVTTLTNIVSLKPTWAYFYVDENTALKLQQMVEKGKIPSEREKPSTVRMALANDTGFPYEGTLDFVSNQFDPNTGSLRVRAVFPNKTGALDAGLFGRVRVPIGGPHKALLVNDQAVGTEQGQKFVLVVNDKNQVEYRAVDVGQVHAGLREVLRFRTITEPGPEGKEVTREVEVLKPTDWVIVGGLQRVRPGVTVKRQTVNMETLMAERIKDKG